MGHLLIVEDNMADLELAYAALEVSDLQCEVQVARNGTEALDVLEGSSTCPDLMLLDLNMPRMNGYEVLAAVRANPAWREVPVVIFTTSNAAQEREACLAAGADDYVVKPERFETLIETFNGLGRRWLSEERCA